MPRTAEEPTMSLIRCKDGKLVPPIIVCRHLADGESAVWVRMATPGEEVDDYLCPDCMGAFVEGQLDDNCLLPLCMHCARDLRAEAGGKVFTLEDRCLIEVVEEAA